MSEDVVNNPSHYNQNGIEVIDVIETYAKNDFRLANAIKYICRCEYKGKKLEDLRKAQWYLNRVIAELTKEESTTFVHLSPERIAGDNEAASHIKAEYYQYDPNEALYKCGNPACREVIHACDTSWSNEDVVGRFCSLVCLTMVKGTR